MSATIDMFIFYFESFVERPGGNFVGTDQKSSYFELHEKTPKSVFCENVKICSHLSSWGCAVNELREIDDFYFLWARNSTDICNRYEIIVR